MIRQHVYLTPFAVAAFLAMTACAPDDDGGLSDAGDDPEPGGTAIITESGDISVLSPLVATVDLAGNMSADILYMELLRGSWEDGRLVYRTAEENPMALARAYEYLPPDSSAIRFHMRSDVRWSDGTPITARDVSYTYEMVADPELASPRLEVVSQLDSVQVENDSTVVFHFERRYPEMLFHSGVPIVPRHVFEGQSASDFASHPHLREPAGNLVVSGPFMVGSWRKGQEIVLVRNPEFQPRAHLDRIVFRIIPDMTTRLTELRTGAADFVKGVPYDQIPALEAQAPHVRFERERQRNYDYIAYNTGAFPAFDDPDVRRALGMAIDVPQIIRSLQMEEYTAHASGPYGPIFSELYDPEAMPPLMQDFEAAERILEEKGWRDEDGDGIREKDGRPFRFTLETNAGNQRRMDAMQIVQQQWRRIGVDARLRTLELNTFFANLYGREYEASLAGWVVGLSPDLTNIFSSASQLNVTGYDNPRTDSLFQLALRQETPEAANEYWRAAAAQLVQDQPYTWLYYIDTVDGVHERLRGMKIDTYGAYQNAWEWWIPRDRQSGRSSADTAGAAPRGDSMGG